MHSGPNSLRGRVRRLEGLVDALADRIVDLTDGIDGLRRLSNALSHLQKPQRLLSARNAADDLSVHVIGGIPRASTSDPDVPATLVVVSTDRTTQPTRLRLHCSRAVRRARLDGIGLVLGVAAPMKDDPRVIQVDLASPPFGPDSPVRVAVVAAGAVDVARAERVY